MKLKTEIILLINQITRKPCSRAELAGMLIQMENGDHISYRSAEFYDCYAFRLDPLVRGSFNNVDGEVVEGGRIQSNVLPSLMTVYT